MHESDTLGGPGADFLRRVASARESLYIEKLLHTEAFSRRSFYTKKTFTQKL